MITIYTPPRRDQLVTEFNSLEAELQRLRAGQHDPLVDRVKREADMLEAQDSIEWELGGLEY